MICLIAPPQMRGVSQWYRDFSQIHDQEVIAALGAARSARPERPQGAGNPQRIGGFLRMEDPLRPYCR